MTAIDSDLDGDVNGDGVVDMDDVDAVLNAYLTDNDSNSAMDVNGDGVIDVSDAQVVLNIYLGKAS